MSFPSLGHNTNDISINITSDLVVSDGDWHVLIIKQTEEVLQLYLDDIKLDDDLETESTHDFLDPYLEEITFGGRQNSLSEGKYLPTVPCDVF